MQNNKKILSVLLALIMALSVIVTPLSVSAAQTESQVKQGSYTDKDGNTFIFSYDDSNYESAVITEIRNTVSDITIPYAFMIRDSIYGHIQYTVDGFSDSAFSSDGRDVPITSIDLSKFSDDFISKLISSHIDFNKACPELKEIILHEDCNYVYENGAFRYTSDSAYGLRYISDDDTKYIYDYTADDGLDLRTIMFKGNTERITVPASLPTPLGDAEIQALTIEMFREDETEYDNTVSALDISALPADIVDRFLTEDGEYIAGRWIDYSCNFNEGVLPKLRTLILPDDSAYRMDGPVCVSKENGEKLFSLDDFNDHPFKSYTDAHGNTFLYFEGSMGELYLCKIRNTTSDIVIPLISDDDIIPEFTMDIITPDYCDKPVTSVDLSNFPSDRVNSIAENLDESLLKACPSLKNIILPDDCDFYMRDGVLYDKYGNPKLSFNDEPNGAYTIEFGGGKLTYEVSGEPTAKEYSFLKVEGLKGDVELPTTVNGRKLNYESVSYIHGQSDLTSITVPDGIKINIYDCPKLRSITLYGEDPYYDEYWTSNSFGSDCPSLTDIKTPDCSYIRFEDGMLYDDNGKLYLCLDKSGSFVIPDFINSIGVRAFSNSPDLTSVTIPASVTDYSAAFFGQPELREVTFRDGVKEISYNAFAACESLEKVSIPATVNRIGDCSFMGCSNLKDIDIPSSVTAIGSWAFAGAALREITLQPDTKIDYCAFGTDEFGDKTKGFTVNGYYGTAAERYARDHGLIFKAAAPATSDEVRVDTPDGMSYSVVDMDSAATPDEAGSGDTPYEAEPLPEGSVIIDSFDIKLRDADGDPVQPESPVTVTIRCSNPLAKVYRREADGSLTDMKASYSDGYLSFEADHFSLYLVVAPPETLTILGDIDGDGEATVLDATYIQRYVTFVKVPFTDEQMKTGDVDGDGDLTVVDATFIQRYYTRVSVPYPIGGPVTK